MAPLHRAVMLVLLGDITAGAVEQGERLPSLTELAAQFDVSTGVIRECQQALQERGLVSIHQGRRAVVTSEDEWDVFDPEVLTALVRGDRAAHLLAEYLESRRILEVEAAGLASERATPGALERLERAFERMQASAERARWNLAAEPLYQSADVEFHKSIVHAARNRPLARLAEPIHRALSATFATLAHPEERFTRGLPEHACILDAICRRDPDRARRAMREHLATVEGYLREHETRKGQRDLRRAPAALR